MKACWPRRMGRARRSERVGGSGRTPSRARRDSVWPERRADERTGPTPRWTSEDGRVDRASVLTVQGRARRRLATNGEVPAHGETGLGRAEGGHSSWEWSSAARTTSRHGGEEGSRGPGQGRRGPHGPRRGRKNPGEGGHVSRGSRREGKEGRRPRRGLGGGRSRRRKKEHGGARTPVRRRPGSALSCEKAAAIRHMPRSMALAWGRGQKRRSLGRSLAGISDRGRIER